MLLYNGIITLDYNPATDVLVTSMPDIRQFALAEVTFCLDLIVDNVRNYDIKNLLLDSSQSIIEVEEEAYKAITTQFSRDLMNTRLRKLARVGPANTKRKREEKSNRLATEIRQELRLSIAFKSFNSRATAMEWLLA